MSLHTSGGNHQVEQLDILKKVELGEISIETAAELLEILEKFNHGRDDAVIRESVSSDATVDRVEEFGIPQRPGWTNIFLYLPLLVGTVFTVLGAYWMYDAYSEVYLALRFWLSWIPFGFGLICLILAYAAQKGKWLYLRINQNSGETPQTIVLAFPLPVSQTKWFIKTFGGVLPGKIKKEELLLLFAQLESGVDEDTPWMIHVDDKDGEKVDIFLG